MKPCPYTKPCGTEPTLEERKLMWRMLRVQFYRWAEKPRWYRRKRMLMEIELVFKTMLLRKLQGRPIGPLYTERYNHDFSNREENALYEAHCERCMQMVRDDGLFGVGKYW